MNEDNESSLVHVVYMLSVLFVGQTASYTGVLCDYVASFPPILESGRLSNPLKPFLIVCPWQLWPELFNLARGSPTQPFFSRMPMTAFA
jgi:hypothetical protein